MPDHHATAKAVFLSYASQDAAAAKRICDALRAAGVEVWFDQNELVGGDQWDAKIRKQIKDCALFVPVISANTQERLEGYFRLEWHLAEQRMQQMHEDAPFLLPVVIDATRDVEARVPGKFTEVQWTRLPAGESPVVFCDRVKALLVAPALPTPNNSERESARSRDPALRQPRVRALGRWPVLVGIGLAAAAIALVWRPWSKGEKPSAAPSTSVTFPVSEARQLVAKAWVLLNKPEMTRAVFDAADTLCQRAAVLDPNDPEVWAVWAHVSTWYIFLAFDHSPSRQEAASTSAMHAMQLDPKSFEARLAQAFYWVRGERVEPSSAKSVEAERMLRTLLNEKPDEPRTLLALGILLLNKGPAADGLKLLEHLAENPAFTAVALNEIGWWWKDGGPRRKRRPIDRSQPSRIGPISA